VEERHPTSGAVAHVTTTDPPPAEDIDGQRYFLVVDPPSDDLDAATNGVTRHQWGHVLFCHMARCFFLRLFNIAMNGSRPAGGLSRADGGT